MTADNRDLFRPDPPDVRPPMRELPAKRDPRIRSFCDVCSKLRRVVKTARDMRVVWACRGCAPDAHAAVPVEWDDDA